MVYYLLRTVVCKMSRNSSVEKGITIDLTGRLALEHLEIVPHWIMLLLGREVKPAEKSFGPILGLGVNRTTINASLQNHNSPNYSLY